MPLPCVSTPFAAKALPLFAVLLQCIQGSWRQNYGLDTNPYKVGSNAACSGGQAAVEGTAAACLGSGRSITCELNATTADSCSDDSDTTCMFVPEIAHVAPVLCKLGTAGDLEWCESKKPGWATDEYCCSAASHVRQ